MELVEHEESKALRCLHDPAIVRAREDQLEHHEVREENVRRAGLDLLPFLVRFLTGVSAEGHRLLVAAAELDADPDYRGFRPLEVLIGTALLTGARKSELFALLVTDIDFDLGYVYLRPNDYYPDRKSRHAVRRVPLWPQLRQLLVPHMGDRAGGLLFSFDGRPLRGVSGSLDRAFARAAIPKPSGKEWHLFRHTYAAMRLQTTDNGAPVSPWTVKDELGHGSLTMIERTYGHLLEVRERLPVVEYRPLKVASPAVRRA
jgi:integrase